MLLLLLSLLLALGSVLAIPQLPHHTRQEACTFDDAAMKEAMATALEQANTDRPMALVPDSILISSYGKTDPRFPHTYPADVCGIQVTFEPQEDNLTPGFPIKFDLFLPSDWNETLVTVGNVAFFGTLRYGDMYQRLLGGNAVMSTDTGHTGSVDGMDNTAKQEHWAWRAMKYSVPLAKAVVSTYYGREIRKSYYSGCSTGGRQGLRQLEEDPGSFDALLIGAPAWDTVGLMTWAAYIISQNQGAERLLYQDADRDALQAALMNVCQPFVENGLVTQSAACRRAFDEAEDPWGEALAGKVEVINSLITPLMDPTTGNEGNVLYEGYDITAARDFPYFIDTSAGGPGVWLIHPFFAQSCVGLQLGADWTALWDDGNYVTDVRNWNNNIRAAVTPSNLSGFQGKIIMYTGLRDQTVPGPSTFSLFKELQGVIGEENISYFEVPGMQHCGVADPEEYPWYIGNGVLDLVGGATKFFDVSGVVDDPTTDAFRALVEWEDGGSQVTSLTAVSFEAGTWGGTYAVQDSVVLTSITEERP